MQPMRIHTARLEVIEVTRDLAEANLDGPAALSALADADIAATWPPEHWEPSAIRWLIDKALAQPDARGWFGWYIALKPGASVSTVRRTLIGTCGCKGPPDSSGTIEVGYGVVSEHQRRGFATEATTGLIQWALRDARVRMITAETFPHLTASLGVMRRLGMNLLGDGSDAGTVRYGVTRDRWRQVIGSDGASD